MSIKLNVPVRVKGQFKVETVDTRTNKVSQTVPYKNNLVLNSFYDRYNLDSSFIGILARVSVGTGNSTPDPTQTKLDNWIAASSSKTLISNVAPANADYVFAEQENQYEFAQGDVVGNIAELGLTATTTTNADVYTRALILDENDNPTTISITSSEILRVTYKITVMIDREIKLFPAIDIAGTPTDVRLIWNMLGQFSMAGGGTSSSLGGYSVGGGNTHMGQDSSIADAFQETNTMTPSSAAAIYSGVAGGSFSRPAQNSGSPDALKMDINFGTTEMNLTGGLRALGVRPSSARAHPSFHLDFDPPIPKTDQELLQIEVIMNFEGS